MRQEERLGGLSILPALGLILGPLVVAGNIRMGVYAIHYNRPPMSDDARRFVMFTVGLGVLFLIFNFTTVQFFRRRSSTPIAMTALLTANCIIALMRATDAQTINPAYQAAPNVMAAMLTAAIWIP